MTSQGSITLERSTAAREFADAAQRLEILDGAGAAMSQAITDELDLLAQIDEDGAGPFRIRIGSHHIKLKKALWNAAVTGAIALLSTADPTPVTKVAAAAKVIDYLSKFRSYIQSLGTVERTVYDLVVAETERRRTAGSVLQSAYPSQDDVARLIEARGHTPPDNLGDVLGSLVTKGGLSVVFENDSTTRYRRVL